MTAPADVGSSPEAPRSIDTTSGCLLVLYAMPVGYVILCTCAVVIARRPPWELSLLDLLFWITVVTIPPAQARASRYAAKAAAAPASMTRKMAAHLGAAALLWIAVQSIQILR